MKKKGLAIGLILVPMLVAVIYFAFFAVDRYVSTSRVVVRQAASDGSPQMPGLAVMLGGLNPTSREETLYLREFVVSTDMLNVLEQKLPWREHYAAQKRDILYWISQDTQREDALKFYQRLVTADFDEITGLLTIEVQALDPKFAQDALNIILEESERFINELSHKMARTQMRFAQSELTNARRNYESRREEMIAFQSANNLLDAEATAKSRASVIAELESELIKERTTLKGLRSALNADTPQVRQQLARISAIEQQLAIETKRLVSASGSEQLNVTAAKYRNLMIDARISEEAYKFGVSAVESARIEASKQIRSLVTIVTPNKPELALYPERLYILFTLFIALLLLYGIVRFVIATVKDHRD